MSKKLFALSFFILILIISIKAPIVKALHKDVLSASDYNYSYMMPATAEGPGIFLPDSPFFFLDNLKQNVRLLFAFSPSEKARVHADIAGERLAELRIMIARKNEQGIKTDLDGIADNLKLAVVDLNEAKLRGQDVSLQAKSINDKIKAKQEVLLILSNQTDGEMKGRVNAANDSLANAKVQLEPILPQNEIENEVWFDLNNSIDNQVHSVSESARQIIDEIDLLTKTASDSSEKSLRVREEALQLAVEQKNDQLRKIEIKNLQAEKAKQDKLIKLNKDTLIQAREAAQKAQEAALKYDNAKQQLNLLRNTSPITPTPTPALTL